ncbi:MAG TPA: alpha/beta hydrolase [Vicinamibacteria bacterium]|nr:alpha/beta hydrolase [Vicinamibacteria bacterium]
MGVSIWVRLKRDVAGVDPLDVDGKLLAKAINILDGVAPTLHVRPLKPDGAGGGTYPLPIRLGGILAALLILGFQADPASGASQAPMAEPVSFRNGNITLSGTLYRPDGPGRHPGVVAFHSANGGTRDFHAYRHLATALPAVGFAVLLFDRRGSGKSTGDFGTATFQDLAADGMAGITLLKSRPDIDPTRLGVWGISQGGWLGPLAATMSTDVAFVVSVSGPGVSPAAQMDYAAAHALRAADQGPAVVDRALRVRAVVNDYFRGRVTNRDAEQAIATIRSEPWFGQVFLPNSGSLPPNPKRTTWYVDMDYDPLQVLSRVRVPIAFFFAEADAWVPVEESITNIRRATGPHSALMIAQIPQTDHLMETGTPDAGGPTSAQYVTRLIEWLRQQVTG